MHTATVSWATALLLAATTPVIAQSAGDVASHPSHHAGIDKKDLSALIPAAAQAAVDIVDAFGMALASGDLKQVETLLEPTAVILESGGAERSRAEYMGHHAKEGGGNEVRFHAHIHETGDGRRRVVRVQS